MRNAGAAVRANGRVTGSVASSRARTGAYRTLRRAPARRAPRPDVDHVDHVDLGLSELLELDARLPVDVRVDVGGARVRDLDRIRCAASAAVTIRRFIGPSAPVSRPVRPSAAVA